jgi:hypothetical protein
MTFVDYPQQTFLYTLTFDPTLKDVYASTKTDKLDSRNTPAAGYSVLYYCIDINP